nr:MAG TPA: hypothetical protein [Caudoviricetes sp.]
MSVTSNCITENSKLHIQEMLLTPQISETVYSDVNECDIQLYNRKQ